MLTALHPPGLTFQQDNVRLHTATLTQNVLRNAEVIALDQSFRSLGLNPITHDVEHVFLNKAIHHRCNEGFSVLGLRSGYHYLGGGCSETF